jgi:hypothetical protein
MAPLLMTGFDRQSFPGRSIREAAKDRADVLGRSVSTGRVQPWDLFALKDAGLPGTAEWADKTLDAIVSAGTERAQPALDCEDCEDLGFYGLVDQENPDILRGLLRREGTGGYEQLTASGTWTVWEPSFEQQLEILTREIALDLAEAVTAGASGLARRYFWPVAFLPPQAMLAASPAPELSKDATDDSGWNTYAVVDDLDPGAVLDLIRLRASAAGPELVAYRGGAWSEAPDLLTQLQGVQPPPLVELDGSQIADVIRQIQGGSGGGGSDTVQAAGPPTKERKKLAESGKALPEGGYPIKNRADLKKAIKAYGRATNPNAAKRHIIKRARALNAIGDLPGAWGVTAALEAEDDLLEDLYEGVTAAGALLAAPDRPLTVSPDPRAERLRRYWTVGKGALKVRWGTPGDWKRCYRHLSKFMGLRAKGYCQNLHKRATGVWTGSRLNPGRARAAALAASAAQPLEAALVAAVSTGSWIGPQGGESMTLKDGVYAEAAENTALLRTLTAGGFPIQPPDEWFQDPKLDGPTPLTVDDDGRVYGHIATFDIAHIGLPGKVHAPKSRSDYAYFKTGQLITASGKRVNVGQLTLAGGHAPLNADAAAAVAHYDNTASAAADLNVGEDRWGIWAAGAVRPAITPAQLRPLRASVPSGDWRPINGHLELVACCQVNVPGFPTVRARVASGAITAMVAAGARPLAARRLALMADVALAERMASLEDFVYGGGEEGRAEDSDGTEVMDPDSVTEGIEVPDTPAELTESGEKPVSDAVQRAREAVAARRAAAAAAEPAVPAEEPQEAPAEPSREDRMAALRARVHGTTAATPPPPPPKKQADAAGDTEGSPAEEASETPDQEAAEAVAAVPGANPQIVHTQIANGQGLGDLSKDQLVQSVHGDYGGDVAKFANHLAKGKVKKPKVKAPAVAASGSSGN